MSKEKILERVRKMLAIANNEAASEEERDNALKMAHDLLARHELDMEDVGISEREKEDPRVQIINDGWNAPYAKSIRLSMARLFRCEYFSGYKINATRGEHHYVGRESAATTAMYMADWIIKGVLKEADTRYGHRLNPTARSFCMGVSARLRARVDEIVEQKQKEFDLTGVALVLYDVAKREQEANEEFIKGLGIELKVAKPRSSTINTRAYEAGKAHADKIQLSTQLHEKKKDQLK